jgi:hypothetical protein
LAHANQDRDRSIVVQCHIARHEVSTHALNKTLEDRHIFEVKKKSFHPRKLDEQFRKIYKNSYLFVTEKQSMLKTMGIMHTSGSKVHSSEMPIGLCRSRLGSIDWSAMLYSSSRSVHSRPKQNVKRLSHLRGEEKIVSPPKIK